MHLTLVKQNNNYIVYLLSKCMQALSHFGITMNLVGGQFLEKNIISLYNIHGVTIT